MADNATTNKEGMRKKTPEREYGDTKLQELNKNIRNQEQ